MRRLGQLLERTAGSQLRDPAARAGNPVLAEPALVDAEQRRIGLEPEQQLGLGFDVGQYCLGRPDGGWDVPLIKASLSRRLCIAIANSVRRGSNVFGSPAPAAKRNRCAMSQI